jgi:hypothetical protein
MHRGAREEEEANVAGIVSSRSPAPQENADDSYTRTRRGAVHRTASRKFFLALDQVKQVTLGIAEERDGHIRSGDNT